MLTKEAKIFRAYFTNLTKQPLVWGMPNCIQGLHSHTPHRWHLFVGAGFYPAHRMRRNVSYYNGRGRAPLLRPTIVGAGDFSHGKWSRLSATPRRPAKLSHKLKKAAFSAAFFISCEPICKPGSVLTVIYLGVPLPARSSHPGDGRASQCPPAGVAPDRVYSDGRFHAVG